MSKYEKNHTLTKGTNKHWCGETNELNVFDGRTNYTKRLNVRSVVTFNGSFRPSPERLRMIAEKALDRLLIATPEDLEDWTE